MLLFHLFDSIALTQVDDARAVFALPRTVNQQKVYPGIKDLPPHIRMNFRNGFIRSVIHGVFNSGAPWANPDLQTLQLSYDRIYPAYPARLQPNDAVSHPVRRRTHPVWYGHLIL